MEKGAKGKDGLKITSQLTAKSIYKFSGLNSTALRVVITRRSCHPRCNRSLIPPAISQAGQAQANSYPAPTSPNWLCRSQPVLENCPFSRQY